MKSIEIISIPVTDQERAKEFYLQLGFQVTMESTFEGDKKWIQMGFSDGGTGITLVNWFDNMPAGCINGLILKTDTLEKDISQLEGKGIKVGKIDETPWGRFATVTDPDNNKVTLHEGLV